MNLSLRCLKQHHFFFLSTPTVAPLLPVVLVLWPLTFRPQWCLIPLWVLIFFILSMSSLSLVSRTLEAICRFLPSLQSLCLLRNHLGTPLPSGSLIKAAISSVCCSESSPALILGLILRILQMRKPNLLPTPLMASMAQGTVLLPSMLVLRIRKMCLKLSTFSMMRDMTGGVDNKIIINKLTRGRGGWLRLGLDKGVRDWRS